MKIFLTLLAAITPWSASTLVSVHAQCAICPTSMGGARFYDGCTQNGVTSCWYYQARNGAPQYRNCQFDTDGIILVMRGFDPSCPDSVQTGSNCPSCP
ncbi:hypothetical protein PAXRUDRAFT_834007 [Paxillus rubicundulus Ve08.2h10]|uniref:Uncharacterized protein n=1 Tax=Paxillus rubicundulus Ve08.2h10 TaxID=930991 RepID=A0A0D0CVY2_9AGAM|nr:hypothetical protein PAXRUDRAFT_834007 [Paxillus rubicundulus Ve08.2h10]